jgi:hypothetical protein
VLNTVFVADPSLAYKLYELAVHIFWRATALFPVENELGSDAFIKRCGNFRSRKDFLSIGAGLPLIVEFRWLFDIKSGVLLAVAPFG